MKPGPNLILENIPPIPVSVALAAEKYEQFVTYHFMSWAPNGVEMLIGARAGESYQIHRLDSPGKVPVQLTSFSDSIQGALSPRDSSNSFVFTKDAGGGEWYQHYRFDTKTGSTSLLTDGGKSRNNPPVFAHRGTSMAYTSTRRDGQDTDLYVVDANDKNTDRMVARMQGAGWQPLDFSPDGSQILVNEDLSVNESNLYLVDIASGSLKRITPDQTAAAQVYYGLGRFSKDGKSIYAITDRDFEFRRLAIFDLATMTAHFLTTPIRWDVEDFSMSEDGSTIAFLTNENGASRLYRLNTTTDAYTLLKSVPEGVIKGMAFSKNGRDLAFNLSSGRVPGDIFSVDVKADTLTRWTRGGTGRTNQDSLREPSLVSWKSFDNLTITGFLYRPDPSKFPGKRPVIIDVHGGPEGQSRPVYHGRNNYLVDELGIAIIYPNVRGSTGYGKTFTTLDNGMLRDHSFRDIGALLDWLPTQPDLDPAHVMVTGGSYGGTMAWAAAAFYDDRITCALPVVGVSNLVTFLEHTEAYRRDLRRTEYGDERDPVTRAYLESIAPMNHLDSIHKPIFAVAGKNDPRVLWTESRQIIDKLNAQGTPTWFLIATDEGHGFRKLSNQEFEFDATVMFIRKYLLGLN